MKTKRLIHLLQTECINNPDIQKYVEDKVKDLLVAPKRMPKTEVIAELYKNDFGMIVPEVENFTNKVISILIA